MKESTRTADTNIIELATFYVGDALCGMDILKIQEIFMAAPANSCSAYTLMCSGHIRVGVDIMPLGLQVDGFFEIGQNLFPGSQSLQQRNFDIAQQARPQRPVGGQPQAVAALTEMFTQWRDEPDGSWRAGNAVFPCRA